MHASLDRQVEQQSLRFAQPLVLVPIMATLVIGGGVAWRVHRWSQAHDWGDLHLLALASGAVICHILIGVLANAQTTADRIGLIVLGLAMIGMLTWLAFRIHKRLFSQDRCVKKRAETVPASVLRP